MDERWGHLTDALLASGMARRSVLAVLLVCGAVSPIAAQTNDVVWRSYGWTNDISAARAAGMAGAFVGLADDSSALLYNPAGIGTLTQSEISGGLVIRQSKSSDLGDTWRSRTGVGYVGGAGTLTPHWAIGGYLHEPQDAQIALGAPYSGSLAATTRDVGAAGSWHPSPNIYIGLRLTDTHLRVQSGSRITTASSDASVGFGAGQDKVTGDAGLLYVKGSLRIGAAYRQGVSFDMNRTAQDELNNVALDLGSNKLFRSPSAFSGGLSYRVNPHLLLTGQVDYVLYSQIQKDLGLREADFTAADYKVDDAAEFRAGAEVALPVGASNSLLFRGGVYSQSAHGITYVGGDAQEASLFPPHDRQTIGSAGVSFWTRTVQLHAAGTFGGDRDVFAVGATVHF